jgi:hypothetical protein
MKKSKAEKKSKVKSPAPVTVIFGCSPLPYHFSEMKRAAQLLTSAEVGDQEALREIFYHLVSLEGGHPDPRDLSNLIAKDIERAAKNHELPGNVSHTLRDIGIGDNCTPKLYQQYAAHAKATKDIVGSTAAFLAGFLHGVASVAWINEQALVVGKKREMVHLKEEQAIAEWKFAVGQEWDRVCTELPEAGQTMARYRRIAAKFGISIDRVRRYVKDRHKGDQVSWRVGPIGEP